MQTVLTRAEIEAHDPRGGRGGRWLCPLPACSDHTDDNHRSLKLETSGLWHCHRCKAGGQLQDHWKPFAWRSDRQRKQEAAARRDALTSKKLEEIGQRFRSLGKPVAVAALLASPQAMPAPSEGNPPLSSPAPEADAGKRELAYRAGRCTSLDAPEAHGFLTKRGFSESAGMLTRAGVRYAQDFGRRKATEERKAWGGAPALVFPVRDAEGSLVAVTGRLIAPQGDQPKALTFGRKLEGLFWTPGTLEAFPKGAPLVVCEAPLDALTLALLDVPAVAMIGTEGCPEFLLRRVFGRRVAVAFDADGPGDKASEKLAALLRSRGAIVERLKPCGAKDWNEALQTGGSVWESTAEVLLPWTGSETEAPAPQLEKVGKESPLPLEQVETIPGDPLETKTGRESLLPLVKVGEFSPRFSRLELETWGRYFQVIAEGRICYQWPTHAPDGSPYEPVRVCQGTTTDDPARWFMLAWERFCRLWHLVHGGEIEGQRLDNARRSLDTLTGEMVAVLEQGETG